MDNIQLLATILQGEAAVLGPAGMTAVAAVFIARLLSPAFPSTVSDVAPPFFGRAQPGAEALAIATHALSAPAAFLYNHTELYGGPYLYCMSAQDLDRHHLSPARFYITRSTRWQLNFYKEDPLEHHHTLPGAPVAKPVPLTPSLPHQMARIQ